MFVKKFWTKCKTVDFGKYSIVAPGRVSVQKTVPNYVKKPSYYETGQPSPYPLTPEIKSNKQIDLMRKSCRLAANVLREAGKQIKVGITTDELDCFVHKLIVANGAYPSPLNYRSFPKSICTSVNNIACHGIPDDRPLENGDIINVDVTVYLDGFHGDCSETFLVGAVDEAGIKLVEAARICLEEAVAICRPDQHFHTIGTVIEATSAKLGFAVVPAFTGHGIGEYFHGPPEICHFGNDFPGAMKAGMTFTIEPVLSQGSQVVELYEDNWTATTEDNSRTAQFEHTVLITDDGAEILTVPG